jgi:tRNA threonylcarbamoyladenosine biosynthesis protein TsaE
MENRVVTISDLPGLAKEILQKLPKEKGSAALITLSGDLGAGKTTFTQALARELGINEAVQSPTYVLMKKYEIDRAPFKTFVHIDAYRLNNAEEFAALKPGDFFADRSALVCIEWPERVDGALPKPDISLQFSSENQPDGSRYIHIE